MRGLEHVIRRGRLGIACAILLAGCGSTPLIRQASTEPPLLASHLDSTQTGNADAVLTVKPGDFRLDDARLLVITVHLRSTAAAPESVAVRASLFDTDGTIVGDASGGTVALKPGAQVDVELNGPTPTGSIARATFEVHTTPAPQTPSS